MVWLHGELEVHVIEAEHLPSRVLIPRCGCFGCGAPVGDADSPLLPRRTYVTLEVGKTTRAGTAVKGIHPEWNERMRILVADNVDEVSFVLKQFQLVGAPSYGNVSFPAEEVAKGEKISGTFKIKTSTGHQLTTEVLHKPSTLRLSLQFHPVGALMPYGGGLTKEFLHRGVLGALFPLRHKCQVNLYNDAHQEGDLVHPITIDGTRGPERFEVRSCWADIYQSIMEAKHFIYIVGWSVFDQIQLVRDPNLPMEKSGQPTLGELLLKKADEGVRVLLLLWDDGTSMKYQVIRSDGIMGTHDEDTRRYFKHTNVVCKLTPREPSAKDSLLQKIQFRGMFTHHQKTVVMDKPLPGHVGTRRRPNKLVGKRSIVAYIGGLDLTDGRYDTKDHPLFSTRETVHSNDWHQACVQELSSKDAGGPREPWHDIHACVEGGAAWDILHNFSQRWIKREKPWRRAMKSRLLNLRELPGMVVPDFARGLNEDEIGMPDEGPERGASFGLESGSWSSQIFRSITSSSAKGLPLEKEGTRHLHLTGLSLKKSKVTESSIHSAYVELIRRAKHFLYIENQYFLGSSHLWAEHTNAGDAAHLIPAEIAMKIAHKISQGEEFRVYAVIPMYPEGVPTSSSVQEILAWQRRTMELMYTIVADAIEAKGIDAHPTDYLMFFCLGNREAGSCPEGARSHPSTVHKRFMIYVHSKMMIVDDEYIILGSANINQRSMDGSRDTEIAMGAFQPYHTEALRGSPARGKVHGFRMNLWEEHTGQLPEVYLQPWTLKCARHLKEVGRRSWELYTQEENCDMTAHLMNYPIMVKRDGSIEPIPGPAEFPDVGGKILGQAIGSMPDILTT